MRESENEELVEAELSNLDIWRLKIDTMYVKKKFISFTHPKNSCHLHLLRISSRNHFETLLIYIRCFIAWRGLSIVNETCIKNPTLDKNQTKPPTFSSTFISFSSFSTFRLSCCCCCYCWSWWRRWWERNKDLILFSFFSSQELQWDSQLYENMMTIEIVVNSFFYNVSFDDKSTSFSRFLWALFIYVIESRSYF